jgi:cardiolipin synthase
MKTKDIKKEFTSSTFFTIPNILSLIRLLMIPLIVWLYCFKKDLHLAFVLFTISALTDVADGFIARRFNMITDAGKILDPIADKLTQAAVIFCLCITINSIEMWILLGVIVVKEITMLVMGLLSLKAVDEINGAKWFGKLSTVVIFLVIGINSLFELSRPVHTASILVAIVFMSLSLVKYALFYKKLISEYKKNPTESEKTN